MPSSTIMVPPKTWTLITSNNVSSLSFQNVGDAPMRIKGAVGAVAPTDATGSLMYLRDQGEQNVLLSELFPGVTGANRVYVWSKSGTRVAASHA